MNNSKQEKNTQSDISQPGTLVTCPPRYSVKRESLAEPQESVEM